MGTRRDWAALRAEAQQRATAQSKHSGGARAVAAAADDLVAALDSVSEQPVADAAYYALPSPNC